MSAGSASGVPPVCAAWRQVVEGALAAAGGLTAMILTAATALTAAGGAEGAPLTRLVPALVSMAVGGGVNLTGEAGGAAGGMLAGMSPGLTGRIGAVPLMLTFVGTVVMATLFFRPLRRRARPTGGQFAARAAGTLVGCVVAVAVLASSAHGTARLPKAMTERLGGGSGGGIGARLGGQGGGGGLSEAAFHTDVVTTVLLAAVWVTAVIAIGCLAARRTRLPRSMEASRVRLRWQPLASAWSGVFTVLCGFLLMTGLVAAGAAAAGREQAGNAAAGMLLAGANLLGVLLTTGVGEPWRAGVRREQGEGAGMLGGMGGQAGGDRVVSLPGLSGGGVPLWLIGLLALAVVLLVVGYFAGARTPARSLREEMHALVSRHLELGLRAAVVSCGAAMAVCLLARGTLRVGFSVMGSEMGGLTVALDGAVGFSSLTAPVVAGIAVSAGSLLQAVRAGRRDRRAGTRPDVPRRRARVDGVVAKTDARH